ncbi:ANTAR domain-containing protein [Nocardioides marinus]|uniref:ANTAR domain-containing protein n=1 Tax=Nocardioides marinus TaxID=374514 RepID=A0A7Y9YH66_9ACTN|nr:ANTAR domain-containing protein [Nocardioides marinus]NYI12196.1 hypothetical protein [Nocardioides marinus]
MVTSVDGAVTRLLADLDDAPVLSRAADALVRFAEDVFSSSLTALTLHTAAGPQWLAVNDRDQLDELLGSLARALGGGTGGGACGFPLPEPGAAFSVPDVRADRRYAWSAGVARTGLRAVLVLGLPHVRRRPVTLDLFSPVPAGLTAARSPQVDRVLHVAGLGLRQLDRAENLEVALRTRTLIGQAQGILMQRLGLSSEQALAYLRRVSMEQHSKVSVLAERLVLEAEGAETARDDVVP